VIARYISDDGGQTLDASSETRLVEVLQEQSNHNGGHVVFGPDGFLYAGFGDGGGANDPGDNAQDTANLLGGIVRLDVDAEQPYRPAAGNLFAANPRCDAGFSPATEPCPEIHAWGL